MQVDLSIISLCDSYKDENVTWYNQSATGDIPSPRIDFCTLPVHKNAKDNSSFNLSCLPSTPQKPVSRTDVPQLHPRRL